jgi:hypothetical protein
MTGPEWIWNTYANRYDEDGKSIEPVHNKVMKRIRKYLDPIIQS